MRQVGRGARQQADVEVAAPACCRCWDRIDGGGHLVNRPSRRLDQHSSGDWPARPALRNLAEADTLRGYGISR